MCKGVRSKIQQEQEFMDVKNVIKHVLGAESVGSMILG